MPVAVDLDRAQFRLAGSDFEPTDLAWTLATPAQRKGYWREVAVLARDRKFAELHKGIGVDGQRLPRRKAPRHDHAAGPVLSPHWSDSRFRTQLRWEGTDKGAILWWKSPWGRIVGYHARGEVRGAPVRNVIGLTAESQRWIRARALKWWDAQVRTGRLGAGATMMGGDEAIVAAAQAAGTFSGWQRVPPPRPDLFRPLAPVRPIPVPAPTLAGALPPWQAIQRVHELWESAGYGKTTRAKLEQAAARLGRTQTLPTLQAILVRWGVVQPSSTKAEAVELIRRNLLSRLTAFRPGRGPTPPPPPKPAPAPVPPDPLADLTATIEAARQEQRTRNAAAAQVQPTYQFDVETSMVRTWRNGIADYRRQIAEIQAAATQNAPAYEAIKKEREKASAKMWDWGLSKQTRAKWEKRLKETEAEYTRLHDAVAAAPYRVKAMEDFIADYEKELAKALAAPEAHKVIPYAEIQAAHPDQIPPGPIEKRLEAYTLGDAKIRAILEVQKRHPIPTLDEQEDTRLATERAQVSKLIGELLVKQADLINEYVATMQPVPPEVQAQVDAIQKQIDELAEQKSNIRAQQKLLTDKMKAREVGMRADALKLFQVKDGVKFKADDVPAAFQNSKGQDLHPLTDETRKAVDEAVAWLSSVMVKADVDEITARVGEAPGRRAHFNHYKDYMQLKTGESADTAVHEFGHGIDYRLKTGPDRVVDRSLEFLKYRVGDEQPIDLHAKFGCGDPGEMGREDKFRQLFSEYEAYYTGKDYGRDATEILSMGLEELFKDPIRVAKNDPEFCKFLLGILDGSLR